ncbi:siderophore-interacting protein [Streptomyces castrisilvae]|uniref:Siderophore-interacting protein n=1 Tax=Streptomyces castrisilvae TaxID=3033811 RepID=A0ABY9HBQ0_9ACTN|nr:siderophore-interacting protein [Streptomyces sp. Mut1]WLQ31935.1 siderophore-interacting protein [Streptomyces sp. Mut1]
MSLSPDSGRPGGQRPPRGEARPGGPRRRPPRQVEVVDVRPLTPRMLSVVFAGESLAGFAEPAPTAHIKLFLPDADGNVARPVAGPDGHLAWPDGRPVMRTYTPRRFDAQARTLEVWFVLHGDGPAARWAAQAEPGSRAAIGGPGGGFCVDPAAASWWIGGDESALPAIATLLEALPDDVTGQVHLEAAGPEDRIGLPAPAGVVVTWHDRAGEPGAALVDTCHRADLADDTHIWIACEASAVRKARSYLLGERMLPRPQVTTRGYWRVGEANHPDHDFGED